MTLLDIYGSEDTVFQHKGIEFTLDEVLSFYTKLIKFKIEINDKTLEQSVPKQFIAVFGQKQLLRRLNAQSNESHLLDLLSYNLGAKNESSLILGKPLLRAGNVFYIIPQWIDYVSPQYTIDKILSNNKTTKVGSYQNKGYFFEDSVEEFFQDQNIPYSRIRRDESKGIPEIDGIFLIDNYLFVFEAKATVQPQNLIQSYNLLQGTIAEGYQQICDRIDLLIFNERTSKEIAKNCYMDFSDKILVPFLLLNHHFFSGYRELRYRDQHIPIIDFLTLRMIINSRHTPHWEYDNEKKIYNRSEIPITNGKDLADFLQNQIYSVASLEPLTSQISEQGIFTRIVKPLRIST